MPEEGLSRGDDGTLAVLHAMLTTFSDVLEAMDRRLSSMELTLQSLQNERAEAEELRTALRHLQRVERIEQDLAEMRPALQALQSDQAQVEELRSALHHLSRVDHIEEDLAVMRTAVESLQSDQEQAERLQRALDNLGRVEAIEADLAQIRAALLDHPVATVHDAMARLTGQVDQLVAQPGPGPAMAMVAAGLSERFEQRTENLVLLLQDHAEVMHALTEQVQESMQGLVVTVEGRQAGLDALLDTVRAVAGTIAGMGARIDEARDRVESVFRAGEDLPATVESLRELEEAIRETAEAIQNQSVAGLTGVVRDEAEMLGQRLAAISVLVDAVGRLLASHAEETAHSLGRKASEAGRRLVADLGLTSRARDKPAKPPPALRPRPASEPPPPPPPPPPASRPRQQRSPSTRKPPTPRDRGQKR